MDVPDLFEDEAAVLAESRNVFGMDALPAESYRNALGNLMMHYERMMRETRRLIHRSDREERELNELNARLQHLTAQLDYKASHDTLTGALNRGAVFELAPRYLSVAPLALVVLDIDFFKNINDAFGHPMGDAVICELVTRLKVARNGVGEVGRVGGEEFTILLPDIGAAEAARMAETMRRSIADHPFACLPAYQVTASFGVSWSPPGGDFIDLYGRADEALYKAKRAGRNRITSAEMAN
ncbi:GGDEF domain-containing protein [Glaciimonas sp. PCH181]|uniref:GGDEF domain-containing protein n=1 Tax=Glaciimonas sp. PCH181 TaxID=2133943 RepID=UPI000D33E889|nr:GGDEF domain-containing protein [Glaciimonas sp. PCH181]PUA17788.1 GGDEF domain-containing protein [Glaciimonas sp. PCH181]